VPSLISPTIPTPAVVSSKLEAPRRILTYCFVAVGLWYLGWRLGTFNPHAPIFSVLIYGAELFGFVTALAHIFMCWRLSERHAPPPRPGISVDVYIPTYSEPIDLVRKTVLAAMAMDYLHRTWILDDGRRQAMRALATELGCEYLARTDNVHAKAGNLNHALAHSQGELIVVFDADHAPRRDFLEKTLGYFDDAHVAFVQTPQDYYNLDSYQHRGSNASHEIWTEQALFFRVIQRGKDCWNSAFFCGSCAVVRRSSLERIGGFATGTITEDLHTSIRLHAAGFRSVYHAEPLAFGLAPESIEPFVTQRVRWGQGAMHVWRTEGILSNPGLSWAQRINYLASVATYFDGWTKGLFYFAPVAVLLTGSVPLVAAMPTFLLHFVPYYIFTFWVFEEVGRGYGRTLYIEQYNMARFAAFAWATLAWFFPNGRFEVTRKGSRARRLLRFTMAQWLVVCSNLLAVPVGIVIYRHTHMLPLAGVAANVLWAGINCGLAAAVLRHTLMVQRRQRAQYRFPVPLPAELDFAGLRVHGTIDNLSEHGMRFYGGLLPYIESGSEFSGRLTLPDGPLPFTGQVRTLIALEGHPGTFKAFGGMFNAKPGDQKRIDRFLYGSDLQWVVNGYSDQVDTPFSRLIPGHVPRARRPPFLDTHWNAAELTGTNGETFQVVLSFSKTGRTQSGWLLSFTQVPEDQALRLDSFRRTDVQPQMVRLQRTDGLQRAGTTVFVYRLTAIAQPVIDSEFVDERRQDVA
jgi:cellulose synthase (UDP-forming)